MVPSDKSEKVYSTESGGEASGQNIGSILANQDSEEFRKLMADVDDVENTFIPAAEENGLFKPEPAEEKKPDLKAIDMDIDDGPVLVPPAETKLATVALSSKPEEPAVAPVDDTAPLPNVVPDVDLSTIEPFQFPESPEQTIELPAEPLFPDAAAAEYPIAVAAAESAETQVAPQVEMTGRQRSDRANHEPQHADSLHADTPLSNQFEEARRTSLWKRLTKRRNRSEIVRERAEEIARERGSTPVDAALIAQQQREVEAAKEVAQPEKPATEEIVLTQEQRIENNPQLHGLLLLGQELCVLKEAHDTSAEAKVQLEAKLQIFRDVYELYYQNGLDKDALVYILRTTVDRAKGAHEVHVHHAAAASVAPSPRVKPEVMKQPPIEAAEQEAETIETPAPSEAVFASSPGVPVQTPETKEPSKLKKIKNWFKTEAALYQEYSGAAWLGNRWNKLGDWLMYRGVTDTMTHEEKEARKEKNRRNNELGVFGLGVALAVGAGAGIFSDHSLFQEVSASDLPVDFGPTQAGGGSGAGAAIESLPTDAPTMQGESATTPPELAQPTTPSLEQIEPTETPEATIPETIQTEVTLDSPAFNIPKGGTGLELFETLNLNADVWNANAPTLLEKFPGDFYSEHGDVRIANEGWLSTEARQFILDIKWGIRG